MTALTPAVLTRAERRALAAIQAELGRLVRYDDESIVHEKWIRQRYGCGCYETYEPARKAVVRTAWHEAGHAVAAIEVGARFSSASIHHGCRTEGRVHAVTSGVDRGFVIDAAGQVAERLMDWSLPEGDVSLRAWLRTWRSDGGDARRFRRAIQPAYGDDEIAAWRHCAEVLTPLRPTIRQVARGLLVHPRHLPYNVAAQLAG
jgi:hypothetical protein